MTGRQRQKTVAEALKTKQAAPLEPLVLNDHALKILESYNTHRQEIRAISEMLTASNKDIHEVQKLAEAAKMEEILAEWTRLKATKARFSDEIVPLCADYLQEQDAKVLTEAARTEARDALDEYPGKRVPGITEWRQ